MLRSEILVLGRTIKMDRSSMLPELGGNGSAEWAGVEIGFSDGERQNRPKQKGCRRLELQTLLILASLISRCRILMCMRNHVPYVSIFPAESILRQMDFFALGSIWGLGLQPCPKD